MVRRHKARARRSDAQFGLGKARRFSGKLGNGIASQFLVQRRHCLAGHRYAVAQQRASEIGKGSAWQGGAARRRGRGIAGQCGGKAPRLTAMAMRGKPPHGVGRALSCQSAPGPCKENHCTGIVWRILDWRRHSPAQLCQAKPGHCKENHCAGIVKQFPPRQRQGKASPDNA